MQNLLDNALPNLRVKTDIPVTDQFDHAPSDIFLEIGFGGGEHLAGLAQNRPDAGFVGAEPFVNGVASLLRHVENENIENEKLLTPPFSKRQKAHENTKHIQPIENLRRIIPG